MTGVDGCDHISYLTPDRVWVSDENNVFLIDTTTGEQLHKVQDTIYNPQSGIHTVNKYCELIYIDKDFKINKLLKDRKRTSTIIKNTYSVWKPQCVYCSLSTRGLLVGMYSFDKDTDTHKGEVTRYNNFGQHTQTIPHNDTPHEFYEFPHYITENNNGDIVVSDLYRGPVVVTSSKGIHRFSYTGIPMGSRLVPYGICVDALSYILVCIGNDENTNTVHMLTEDGQFLKYFLTKQSPGVDKPYSLSYDIHTHLLWAGS